MSQSNPFTQLFRQQSTLVKLAVLQPGEGNAPINITLTDFDVAETSYECISYDRTKDDNTVEVLVDNQTQVVPKYLESGLRTFRRKDRPRTLWADLLIGNNVEERSKEAGTMRTILEHSERTLCWTGPGNERTAKAYGIIREMANRWTRACTQVNMPASWTKATTQQMQSVMDRLRSCPDGDLESFDLALWNEIYDVIGSPYWKSVQCLPEIVLAKKAIVVCGRSNMPWEDFQVAPKALAVFQGRLMKVPLLPKVMKNVSILHGIEIAERRRRAGESIELLPMIMSARDADPKDPRESVFAMLPIVTPSKRLDYHDVKKQKLPEIDYLKNVQEVFTEASKYIIQERQDLMLWWSERAPCARRIKGLPSWAPDWSVGNGGSSALHPTNGLRRWSDSVTPKKPLSFTDGNTLRLQAYPLDKVVYVSQLFHAGNCRRLALKEWQKLEPAADGQPEIRREKFWRTLISNNGGLYGETMTSNGIPPDHVGIEFQSLLAEEQILEKLNCTKEQLAQPEFNVQIDRNDPVMKELFGKAGRGVYFDEYMKKSTWGRRFFRTESGKFGMTGVENYSMIDSMYRNDEPEPKAATDEQASNIGGIMSDPLARSMLESFQKFLLERDPNAAEITSKMMRGELPHQQNQPKTGGVSEGDIIVACVGGFHPYVLRPKMHNSEADETIPGPQADATYEFVGDCYLHGVMDGECFARPSWFGRESWATDMSKMVDIRIV